MGNTISLSNINEQSFPNDTTYFFTNYTIDNGQTFHPFRPGDKYYFKYKVIHNDTGRYVEKIYSTPFYIKPLFDIVFFKLRIIADDSFRYKIVIENLSYSHDMYRNTQVRSIIQARYFNEEISSIVYDTLDRWIITQDFDMNDEIGWNSFDQTYIGKWFSIEVAMYDTTTGELLLKKTTPRIFIPILIPTGQEITIYPQAIL